MSLPSPSRSAAQKPMPPPMAPADPVTAASRAATSPRGLRSDGPGGGTGAEPHGPPGPPCPPCPSPGPPGCCPPSADHHVPACPASAPGPEAPDAGLGAPGCPAASGEPMARRMRSAACPRRAHSPARVARPGSGAAPEGPDAARRGRTAEPSFSVLTAISSGARQISSTAHVYVLPSSAFPTARQTAVRSGGPADYHPLSRTIRPTAIPCERTEGPSPPAVTGRWHHNAVTYERPARTAPRAAHRLRRRPSRGLRGSRSTPWPPTVRQSRRAPTPWSAMSG
ncbi:hypothetical protein SANTM175S_01119 [Streptomyces antimycoticus]